MDPDQARHNVGPDQGPNCLRSIPLECQTDGKFNGQY